jgi:hypothetical protein
VRFKLEFASVAWDSMTLTDSLKIERIQRKITDLRYKRLFSNFGTNKYDYIFAELNMSNFGTSKYGYILARLNISVLQSSLLHINALFLINDFNNRETTRYLVLCIVQRPVLQPEVWRRLPPSAA